MLLPSNTRLVLLLLILRCFEKGRILLAAELKTYHCIVFTNVRLTILYSFQNLSLGSVPYAVLHHVTTICQLCQTV